MMQLKPSLHIDRLLIKQNDKIVYDENFHLGVNFIIGDNGSGKTTIIESIIHVLGGDIVNKKHEFSNCSNVYAQVNINGKTYVFKRDITNDASKPPLDIYEGTYEDSQISSENLWSRYTLRRSNNQKSFSEMIFTLLGLPEEKLENSQNITINSILRLLYEDQQSDSDKIFKNAEYPAEKGDTRQAISDLLLNIDDFALLNMKTKYNNKNREYGDLDGQLKQIHAILGHADISTSLSDLSQQREKLNFEKSELIKKIESNTQTTSDDIDNSKVDFEKVRQQLSVKKKEICEKEALKESTKFDLEDSKEFLESLNIRLDALSVSTEISKYFGGIDFTYCPSCFHPLDETKSNKGKCSLCKEDINSNSLSAGFIKMINEINFQKKETEAIIVTREKKIQSLDADIARLKSQLQDLECKYSVYINKVSPIDAQKRFEIEKIGYLTSQIEIIQKNEQYALTVDNICKKRKSLGLELAALEEKIKTLENQREQKRNKIYSKINDFTVELIHNDPSNELENVDHISFDFARDELFTPNKTSPAASTGCYLKNAFFFSIFLTSLHKDLDVRYPRFIILDNVEDKGLETNRIQQFHRDVIERSKNSQVEHQIIITARSEVVTDEIRNSDMIVGEEYNTMQRKYSLEFKKTHNSFDN